MEPAGNRPQPSLYDHDGSAPITKNSTNITSQRLNIAPSSAVADGGWSDSRRHSRVTPVLRTVLARAQETSASDQADHEDHQEHEEQHAGDTRRRVRNAAEAEHAGDQRDDQK